MELKEIKVKKGFYDGVSEVTMSIIPDLEWVESDAIPNGGLHIGNVSYWTIYVDESITKNLSLKGVSTYYLGGGRVLLSISNVEKIPSFKVVPREKILRSIEDLVIVNIRNQCSIGSVVKIKDITIPDIMEISSIGLKNIFGKDIRTLMKIKNTTISSVISLFDSEISTKFLYGEKGKKIWNSLIKKIITEEFDYEGEYSQDDILVEYYDPLFDNIVLEDVNKFLEDNKGDRNKIMDKLRELESKCSGSNKDRNQFLNQFEN